MSEHRPPSDEGIVSPNGPTDLSLGSLLAATAVSFRERSGGLAGRAFLEGLGTAGWALFMTLGLSCFAPGFLVGGRGLIAIAAAMTASVLWAVAVSAVASRAAADLVRDAVRTVRHQPLEGAFNRPKWAGRVAACAAPLVIVAATAISLPLFAAGPLGVPIEAAIVFAGLALLIVPAALFVTFWPAAFLICDRDELTGLRPLIAAWRAGEDVRGATTAAGLFAYALLAWPIGLFLGGTLLSPQSPVPFFTLGATVVGWPFTAPPAFLLLAHAFDRMVRLEAAAEADAGYRPGG